MRNPNNYDVSRELVQARTLKGAGQVQRPLFSYLKLRFEVTKQGVVPIIEGASAFGPESEENINREQQLLQDAGAMRRLLNLDVPPPIPSPAVVTSTPSPAVVTSTPPPAVVTSTPPPAVVISTPSHAVVLPSPSPAVVTSTPGAIFTPAAATHLANIPYNSKLTALEMKTRSFMKALVSPLQSRRHA
jgi:hypothetical protein